MTAAIEIIARAVILVDGHVLLARQTNAARTFLPGGHIEFGEPADAALRRELAEELGMTVTGTRFLGAVEHAWDEAGTKSHEINLIFSVEVRGLSSRRVPASRESHLEFLWQPLSDLAAKRLEPSVFAGLLPQWIARQSGAGWGSTMGDG